MNIRRFVPFLIIPLLFACFPKKPEIPLYEAPAGPVVEALERRVRSFESLKAFAEMQAVRKNRKRFFDSVAVLVKGQERFRIEAYGPLGQSLLTAVWSGKDIVLDLGGERRVLSPGSFLFERALGADVDPAELCAILSGNIPGPVSSYQAKLLCSRDGDCTLELRRGETLLRLHHLAGWDSGPLVVPSWEMIRGGKFVYRVLYTYQGPASEYPVPKEIRIENPDRRTSLTIRYTEAEANVPIDDQFFLAPGEGSGR